MKNYALKLVWLMTACLFVFVVLSSLKVAFPVLLTMLIVGQVLLMYTVYKVLTDNFHTRKRFKDWYADMPKRELDKI